jgi:hypothetical protein
LHFSQYFLPKYSFLNEIFHLNHILGWVINLPSTNHLRTLPLRSNLLSLGIIDASITLLLLTRSLPSCYYLACVFLSSWMKRDSDSQEQDHLRDSSETQRGSMLGLCSVYAPPMLRPSISLPPPLLRYTNDIAPKD